MSYLRIDAKSRHLETAALRRQGVELAEDLLNQEIEPLADRSTHGDDLATLLADYREGRLDVMVQVDMIGEGTDIKPISVIVKRDVGGAEHVPVVLVPDFHLLDVRCRYALFVRKRDDPKFLVN